MTSHPATGRQHRRLLSLCLGLAGLTLGLLAVPSAAGAAPATPSNPSPTGAVSSNTPVLSWSKVATATKYEVQVDADPGFASPELTSTTTNNRAVPLAVLATGAQYWRVRAIDSANVRSGWLTSEFHIDPVAAPLPTAPADGAVLEQPEQAPLLAWTGIPGATSYTVEVDTDEDFVDSRAYSTKTTSLVVPDPLEARRYWWRVTAAKGPGVLSLPSRSATFDIGALDAVELISPDDDTETEVEDVVLDWAPVPGAQYYQVRVATDADFNTIIDDQTKVLGTRFSPKTTYDNNQYYWQVRAVDLAGRPTAWSSSLTTFNRVWPDRPTPVHPSGPGFERVESPLHFQWSPVQHATQYQLDVGSDEFFSPGTFESCLVAGTTYTPGAFAVNPATGTAVVRNDEECVPQPGVVTYWRVRPLDRPFAKSGSVAGVQGLFSPTEAFVYDPAYFSSLSPADGATVDVPTLSWVPVRAAEKYKVVIRNASGTTVKSDETYSTSYTPVGSVRLDPSKNPYTWTVQAIEANKTESKIYQRQFNVSRAAAEADAAPLTALSGRLIDPETGDAPSLRWQPLAEADHYRIFVGPAGSNTWFTTNNADVLGSKLFYPAVTDTSRRFFAPGSYDWQIRAYSSAGTELLAGPIETFRVGRLAQVTGQEIALDGSTLDAGRGCRARLAQEQVCDHVPATPVLDWDAVPGASYYMVYVSEDASFTNLLEPSTAIPTTTNTRWVPTLSSTKSAYPDSQAGSAYYWHIRPCKSLNVCAADPVSSTGMATNAFRKESPPVQLLRPLRGTDAAPPTIATSELTFDWQDYLDTNRAHVWAATQEESTQAAMQYRVQVDESPTFSGTLIDDQKVDQSTYTAAHQLYPEGLLYWRVQAIDAEGNGLSWSEPRSFRKVTPPVDLTTPANGARASGTAPFEWTSQSFNASYRVEVYRNGDTTFSPTNRVFYKDVRTPAYAWDQPIPASTQPYVWRVRRTDASGNHGGWSATGTFWSAGAAPDLVAPTDGVYVPADGPLFTWSSVPGATTYELDVRLSGGTSGWERVTTAATAWAATRTLPDGAWQWRVTAKDASKNPIGDSVWGAFRVDGTRPTVVSRSPVRVAGRTANFTARLSERVTGVTTTTMRLYAAGRVTPLSARVSLSRDGRTATLDPAANLRTGTRYTLRLTSGVKDLAGNPLVATEWKVRAK